MTTSTDSFDRAEPLAWELRWFVQLRWFAGLTVILGTLTNARFAQWTGSHAVVLSIGLAILAYNAILWTAFRDRQRAIRDLGFLVSLAWVQIFLDMACLTLVILWTGGMESPLLWLFALHMVFASLLLPQLASYFVVSAALGMVFVGLAWKHHLPRDRHEYLITLGWAATLFLTAFLTNHIVSTLRRREDELQHQYGRMQTVLQTAGDGVIVVNQAGIIETFNPAAERMFGYLASEVLGESVSILIPQRFEEDHRRGLTAWAASGESSTAGRSVELYGRRKDGTEFPFELTFGTWGPEGSRSVTGIVRDITRRRKAAEELVAAHGRLEAIRRIGSAASSTLDLQTVLLKILDGTMEAAGASVGMIFLRDPGEDTLSLGVSRGLSTEFVTSFKNNRVQPGEGLTGRIAESGMPIFIRDNSSHDDRVARSVIAAEGLNSFVGVPIMVGGDVLGVMNILTRAPDALDEDVQLLILAVGAHVGFTIRNARLFAERERLFTAVHSASESIAVTDLNGVIQYVNPAFEKITGYVCEDVIGESVGILEAPDLEQSGYEELKAAQERGDVWSGRLVSRRADGILYDNETSVSPVRYATGSKVSYVWVSRDITEQKKAETALKELNAKIKKQQQAMIQHEKMIAVGRMAAGVAHEISNPLANIDSYLQLARRQPERLGPASLDTIQEQTARIGRIIRQLTGYAHPAESEWQLMSVEEMVATSLAMLRFDHRRDIIHVEEQLLRPSCHIRVQPYAIQQVLVNLMLNAFDAVAEIEEPRVIVKSECLGTGFCHISICDNGHGIAEEHMDQLFEPFFTTKPTGQGTGLGLSISYGLAQRHGGRLGVQSKVGEGTTFSIYLPVAGESSGGRECPECDVPDPENLPG